MEFHINVLAVLACGIANMVIGMLWYGPLWGKMWAEEMGFGSLTPDAMKKMKQQAAWAYPQAFLGGLLMNYVFAHVLKAFTIALNAESFLMALTGAFWMWIGFIVPVKYGQRLWGSASFKLFFIDAFYYLVTLSTAATILTLWK